MVQLISCSLLKERQSFSRIAVLRTPDTAASREAFPCRGGLSHRFRPPINAKISAPSLAKLPSRRPHFQLQEKLHKPRRGAGCASLTGKRPYDGMFSILVALVVRTTCQTGVILPRVSSKYFVSLQLAWNTQSNMYSTPVSGSERSASEAHTSGILPAIS